MSFDPTTLALSGYWRPDYGGVPWAGTASAGASAGRSLTEATNPAAVGTAINGKLPADFDGTNDQLGAGVLTLGDFYDPGGTAYSGWTLLNIDAIATDDGAAVYENDCVITTQPAAYWILFLRSSGLVGIRHIDAGEIILTATFATGAWKLVQWVYDGTNLKLRVNNGAWQSTAAGTLAADFSSTMEFGTNYDGVHFMNGRAAEFALSAAAFSLATFDKVGIYCQDAYRVDLGFPYPLRQFGSDQRDRRQLDRLRTHVSRMQSYAGRVDPPATSVSLLQPNRRAQPDAIDRRQILARMPSVTMLSPLPIPTDTTAFAQMRAVMPDVLSRRFHRAALNDAAELPPFQPPALTPVALTEWPDRITSPSRQAFRDAGPTFPTQQTITPVAMTTWPDIISKPTRVRDAGAVLPPPQIANAVTPVALTTCPSAAPRPRFGAHLQLQVTSVPPQPERTSPLVEADFPAAVRRPQLAAAQHRFFAMAPKPEQKIALGFQGRFPQYTRRPIFPASQQKSVAYWPFPLPDAPIVPDIVARDAVAVWMLPSHAVAVSKGAHDAVEVWKLPRRTGIVVRFARDTAEVETLPGSTTRVRGTS